MESLSWRDTYTHMLFVALFMIAETWKQFVFIDGWMDKDNVSLSPSLSLSLSLTHTQIEKWGGEYYSAIKKEILPFVTCMELEGIMLGETNQTEKDRYCMFSFMCEI